MDLDDLVRFNESVDQSLTEGVRSYTAQVQREKEVLLQKEQLAREEAEASDRSKDIFLATLSHELRTPLNAIVGWLAILRMGGFTEENLSEGLSVMERNTKVQLQLMDDVLDVSRIVSGKLRLEICECDVIEAIQAGVEVVRPAADAKGVHLEVQLDENARRISCDSARVQQVVWNLMTNAVKFSSSGGTVRLKLSREAGGICIRIEDQGKGISPEFLPHVFDRFRQADDSARRVYKGLGLGLSIVKHLTEMHGGTVEVQSAGENQGATFSVFLPIRPVLAENLAEISNPSNSSGSVGDINRARLDGLHLLVVDDEPDALRMLTKILVDLGARVTSASNYEEALAALATAAAQKELPDLLVSDIGMPEKDGYDLIREVRKQGYRELPALALTAFIRNMDVEEATRAGFQRHLSKPVNIAALTGTIIELCPPPKL